jgi:putative protein kinase ArgK-like GTPase of G3E family
VENTEKALKSMLDLAHPAERVFQHHGSAMRTAAPKKDSLSLPMWITPILRTVATEGKGIAELAESIARHVAHLTQSGDWTLRERARLEVELDTLIRESLLNRFKEDVPQKHYDEVLEKVIQRNISPWEAVKMLLSGRSK